MAPPRLHLVVPETTSQHAIRCFTAACAAGDVASVLAPGDLIAALQPLAVKLNVALLSGDEKHARQCDGIEIATRADYDHARSLLGPDKIIGALCGVSRHTAMDLAEAGADYVAFHQARLKPHDEPIIAWWSGLFEVPCIAADPVGPEQVAALLTQQPDFIRPPDSIWTSPEEARRIVTDLMQAMSEQAP
ncbi:thiamine phosphate synthase [Taklimakanibacter lacteus]|uniref:thiamine phosphate synthase n=1 Tax=Taklimakanibacter lacteus TaxID=2268456 RepID=UPI000E672573